MIKDRYITQRNYEGNLNGYRQWWCGENFDSSNSANIVGVDYFLKYDYSINKLLYLT